MNFVKILKLENKDSKKITYAIKHPCQMNYFVSTNDGLLEYTESEIKDMYKILDHAENNLNELLKTANF